MSKGTTHTRGGIGNPQNQTEPEGFYAVGFYLLASNRDSCLSRRWNSTAIQEFYYYHLDLNLAMNTLVMSHLSCFQC
jgi:hypothetical protein